MQYSKGSISELSKIEIDQVCTELNSCDNIDYFRDGTDVDYIIDNWYLSFKLFITNTMTLGYPSKIDTKRIKKYEHKEIMIGFGREEWGAEKGKLYFVIKHGELIND